VHTGGCPPTRCSHGQATSCGATPSSPDGLGTTSRRMAKTWVGGGRADGSMSLTTLTSETGCSTPGTASSPCNGTPIPPPPALLCVLGRVRPQWAACTRCDGSVCLVLYRVRFSIEGPRLKGIVYAEVSSADRTTACLHPCAHCRTLTLTLTPLHPLVPLPVAPPLSPSPPPPPAFPLARPLLHPPLHSALLPVHGPHSDLCVGSRLQLPHGDVATVP
jgi:hypothetical protein